MNVVSISSVFHFTFLRREKRNIHHTLTPHQIFSFGSEPRTNVNSLFFHDRAPSRRLVWLNPDWYVPVSQLVRLGCNESPSDPSSCDRPVSLSATSACLCDEVHK